jgi:hypothetical protein
MYFGREFSLQKCDEDEVIKLKNYRQKNKFIAKPFFYFIFLFLFFHIVFCRILETAQSRLFLFFHIAFCRILETAQSRLFLFFQIAYFR